MLVRELQPMRIELTGMYKVTLVLTHVQAESLFIAILPKLLLNIFLSRIDNSIV